MSLIDDIATYDAAEIKRLTNNGEPLSTVAAAFGYTPSEARTLLALAENNRQIMSGWWKEVAA